MQRQDISHQGEIIHLSNIIKLFYLIESGLKYGGWKTYSSHLKLSLGDRAELYAISVSGKSEKTMRDFGNGLQYRNVSTEEALAMDGPKIVVASPRMGGRQDDFAKEAYAKLVDQGAYVTIHDPQEIRYNERVAEEHIDIPEKQMILISKYNLKWAPRATYIPHPYVRPEFTHLTAWNARVYQAASVARMDHDKNTVWMWEANRHLSPKNQIYIRGKETRTYTNKWLKKYPEYTQDNDRPKNYELQPIEKQQESKAHFPLEIYWSRNILSKAKFGCDFSAIYESVRDNVFSPKGTKTIIDGGRGQYTFYEAWDAGAIPLLNKDWILYDEPDCNEMIDAGADQNCFTVEGEHCKKSDALVDFLSREYKVDDIKHIQENGIKVLETLHNPESVAKQYLELFHLKHELDNNWMDDLI